MKHKILLLHKNIALSTKQTSIDNIEVCITGIPQYEDSWWTSHIEVNLPVKGLQRHQNSFFELCEKIGDLCDVGYSFSQKNIYHPNGFIVAEYYYDLDWDRSFFFSTKSSRIKNLVKVVRKVHKQHFAGTILEHNKAVAAIEKVKAQAAESSKNIGIKTLISHNTGIDDTLDFLDKLEKKSLKGPIDQASEVNRRLSKL